jgi:hypothetical protein
VAQVFAGFITGYAFALVLSPLIAYRLLRARTPGGWLERLMPQGTPVLAVAMVVHGALFIVWTGAGILLGLLLYGLRDQGEGAGSANLTYTLAVVVLTAVAVLPVAAFSFRLRPWALLGGLVAVALFGWLMPYLAEWSNFSAD